MWWGIELGHIHRLSLEAFEGKVFEVEFGVPEACCHILDRRPYDTTTGVIFVSIQNDTISKGSEYSS
jgi:hypothetical protein